MQQVTTAYLLELEHPICQGDNTTSYTAAVNSSYQSDSSSLILHSLNEYSVQIHIKIEKTINAQDYIQKFV